MLKTNKLLKGDEYKTWKLLENMKKKQALRKEQLPRTLDVRQWNHRVYMFEIELKELKTDKYFMSSKSLKMWIKQTGSNTYKNRPIEVDDSIPYGAVESRIQQ